MKNFASETPRERATIIIQIATDRGINPIIVEKDFWVTWILARITEIPAYAGKMVFKGGTSLSKAYKAIARFSEDVDLAIDPALVGLEGESLRPKKTGNQRELQKNNFQQKCSKFVREDVLPALEKTIQSSLGGNTSNGWISDAGQSDLTFNYPAVISQAQQYIKQNVKLEFGTLPGQIPTQTTHIQALLADEAGLLDAYDDLEAKISTLAVEKTFWEKATILHAEYHRAKNNKQTKSRYSRHYSDFAALWKSAYRAKALEKLHLLAEVVAHKEAYFADPNAKYHEAIQSRLRLVPAKEHEAELVKDYQKMREMFFGTKEPPTFGNIIEILGSAENEIVNLAIPDPAVP